MKFQDYLFSILIIFFCCRGCLYLLPFDNPEIQEERNLLSAFNLLNDFGVKLLPIQGMSLTLQTNGIGLRLEDHSYELDEPYFSSAPVSKPSTSD